MPMTTAALKPPQTGPAPVPSESQKKAIASGVVFTLRFYVLFLLGLGLPLLSGFVPKIGLGLGWGLLIIYDLVFLAIALVDFRRSLGWQLNFQRHSESRLSIGRQNPIRLEINVSTGPKGSKTARLQLREFCPAEWRLDRPQLDGLIKPQTQLELSYHVFPPRRGKFAWQGLDVRLASPWGLVWRSWHEPLITHVEVYPDLIGLRALSVRLTLESSGNLRRRQQLLGGTEFSELRDYTVGDDLRLLDWKATARRGRPLIRLMEPERDQPLIILLDRGRLMTATVAGLKRFDWALNATLALAMAGLRRGDRVGICIFDHEIQTWIAPQSGPSHLPRILSQVYFVEPVLRESDYIGTVSTLLSKYTRRALVVLLTDLVDATASAELLAAMGRLTPRFLPFCVALRDPQVDALAHRPLALPITLRDQQVQTVYEQAVAIDLIRQRSLAFAQLHQKGVLVLDAPANTISEQLVDRYLLLKARNRL
jgi:uncharacterized protein (DUF58 family)